MLWVACYEFRVTKPETLKAEKAALEAIRIGKEEGDNVKETEMLLQRIIEQVDN